MGRVNIDNYRLISNYIDEYTESNGVSPSVREIEAGTGIPRSTVSRYLRSMKESGLVEYDGCRSLVTKEAKKIREQTLRVPVAGAISCGLPKFAQENIEAYVRLPVALFGSGDYYILRADGDSMINVGINIGDLVLIQAQNYAQDGQIVVALVDNDSATLKRYHPRFDEDCVVLRAENEKYADQYIDLRKQSFLIQGVAVKVIKNLL